MKRSEIKIGDIVAEKPGKYGTLDTLYVVVTDDLYTELQGGWYSVDREYTIGDIPGPAAALSGKAPGIDRRFSKETKCSRGNRILVTPIARNTRATRATSSIPVEVDGHGTYEWSGYLRTLPLTRAVTVEQAESEIRNREKGKRDKRDAEIHKSIAMVAFAQALYERGIEAPAAARAASSTDDVTRALVDCIVELVTPFRETPEGTFDVSSYDTGVVHRYQ